MKIAQYVVAALIVSSISCIFFVADFSVFYCCGSNMSQCHCCEEERREKGGITTADSLGSNEENVQSLVPLVPGKTQDEADAPAVHAQNYGDNARFLFLHMSWEQFNAGKRTLEDFVFLSVLMRFQPVEPFLGVDTQAFIGHKLYPKAAMPITKVMSVTRLGTTLAEFDDAISICKDKIAVVYVDHGESMVGDLCTNLKTIQSTESQWGADAEKRLCIHTQSMDVEELVGVDAQCIVLVNFHGLRNKRGKILWEHSSLAVDSYNKWMHTKKVLDSYFEAWVLEPPSFAPSVSHLVRAAECVYSFSNHSDTFEYDAIHLRMEKIGIGMEKRLDQTDGYDQKTFILNCIDLAADEFIKITKGFHRPVALLADVGPLGSKTAKHHGDFPQFDELQSQLLNKLGSADIFGTEACNEGCIGPQCFMLDQVRMYIWRFDVQ